MQFELDEVIYPEEATSLRIATLWAIKSTGAFHQFDRDRVAGAVLAIARSGYSRSGDGHFDAQALGEAAANRFNSFPNARL